MIAAARRRIPLLVGVCHRIVFQCEPAAAAAHGAIVLLWESGVLGPTVMGIAMGRGRHPVERTV